MEAGGGNEALLGSGSYPNAHSPRIKYENVDDRVYKDWVFAAAFVVTSIIIASFGFSSGITALHFHGASETTVGPNNVETVNHDPDANAPSRLIGGAFILLFSSLFISLGVICVMAYLSKHSIHFICMFAFLFTLIAGVCYITLDDFVVGVLLIVLSICILFFYSMTRKYIQFASVNLKVAATAIRDMPTMIGCAVLMAVMQLVMSILWLLAVLGEATNESHPTVTYRGQVFLLEDCSSVQYVDCQSNGGSCHSCVCDSGQGPVVVNQSGECFQPEINAPAYIALILALLWICAVFGNVVHYTVSAAVSTWWCRGRDALGSTACSSHQVVRTSLARALTTSFGTVCLGSLVVAVLTTTRFTVSVCFARMQRLQLTQSRFPWLTRFKDFVFRTLQCFLRILEQLTEYCNFYALCFSAIYGYNFLDSSKAAANLFRRRGWTAVLNDDIISTTIFLCHVTVGIICAILASGYAGLNDVSLVNTALLITLGYLTGHMMCNVMMSVLSSSVTAVFVNFAERPDAFEAAHPELYRELYDVWMAVYPNEFPRLEEPVRPSVDDERLSSSIPASPNNNSSSGPVWASANAPYLPPVPSPPPPPNVGATHKTATTNTGTNSKGTLKDPNNFTNSDGYRGLGVPSLVSSANPIVSFGPPPVAAVTAYAGSSNRSEPNIIFSQPQLQNNAQKQQQPPSGFLNADSFATAGRY